MYRFKAGTSSGNLQIGCTSVLNWRYSNPKDHQHMAINETSFTINVTAASGENYAGPFTVRRRLSHMQTLRRDELRRELLGSKPDAAPDSLKQNAYILSTCAAYVKEAPSWWTNASNGVDLLDEEPVGAVFEEVLKIQEQVNKELEERADKAKQVLKGL